MLRAIFFCGLLLSCSHQAENSNLLSAQKKVQAKEAFGKKFMVSTQGEFATRAGIEILEQGGNLFDAFAAISFVIAVERPQSTGLGGGGFLVYHKADTGESRAVDFREKAPLRAEQKMYLNTKGKVIDRLSLDGPLAAGVPGMVAGVLEIHAKEGRLSRQKILAPAIRLASEGLKVYPELAKALAKRAQVLQRSSAARKIFFRSDGRPLQVGDWLVQKDLAKTLQAIELKGRAGFYEGWVARAIVEHQHKNGGLISRADLRRYNVKYRQPVSSTYKNYRVLSMPPPSSGGIHVIQILNLLEKDDLQSYGALTAKSVHMMTQAMQTAFVDRASYLGDADFVRVPIRGLTSKRYARELRAHFNLKRARKLEKVAAGYPWAYESDQTTHFTLMDAEGNTLVSTQTINGLMGAAVVVPETGILLNNEMDDFAAKIGASNLFQAMGGEKNLIAPGKRPLSSMSPTIVFEGKRPILALGTPAGTRILTCVAQVILNYLAFEMPLDEAVSSLRFHHQWSPDYIRVEAPGFSSSLTAELQQMGHDIEVKNLGCRVQAIAFEKGQLHGMSDPRGEGSSSGL